MKTFFLVLIFLFPVNGFVRAEDASSTSSASTVPAQSGTTYSPTQGWVKTSSASLNPVTDYLEGEHRKSAAEDEKKKEEKKPSDAKPKYRKPRVFVS